MDGGRVGVLRRWGTIWREMSKRETNMGGISNKFQSRGFSTENSQKTKKVEMFS